MQILVMRNTKITVLLRIANGDSFKNLNDQNFSYETSN